MRPTDLPSSDDPYAELAGVVGAEQVGAQAVAAAVAGARRQVDPNPHGPKGIRAGSQIFSARADFR